MNCPVCLEAFTTTDRVPLIVCSSFHSVCRCCVSSLKSCPFCRSILNNPKPNISLVNLLESIQNGDLLRDIPSSELQIDFNNGLLGHGSCGKVYRASWDCEDVAIKLISLTEQGLILLRKELAVMKDLDHPRIARVFGLCFIQDKVGIVMEKADSSLKFPSKISYQTLSYALQIVAGIKYLHSRNVIHSDIKPANILLKNGKTLLTDFGTSKTISSSCTMHTALGYTPLYAPLEAFDSKICFESDVYSLGLVLYEILCNQPVFQHFTPVQVMGRKYRGYCPPFDDWVPGELQQLISQCCDNDTKKRPSLDEIMSLLKQLQDDFQPTDSSEIVSVNASAPVVEPQINSTVAIVLEEIVAIEHTNMEPSAPGPITLKAASHVEPEKTKTKPQPVVFSFVKKIYALVALRTFIIATICLFINTSIYISSSIVPWILVAVAVYLYLLSYWYRGSYPLNLSLLGLFTLMEATAIGFSLVVMRLDHLSLFLFAPLSGYTALIFFVSDVQSVKHQVFVVLIFTFINSLVTTFFGVFSFIQVLMSVLVVCLSSVYVVIDSNLIDQRKTEKSVTASITEMYLDAFLLIFAPLSTAIY
ncbi:hypothetical protein RCL1_002145 [Eukaryota sp. TZLM3-RCL]